jgi:3-carboxy-cis,cis-muconate cycloisomerase
VSTLFWPGDDGAGTVLSESAFLDAMVGVESAWLQAMIEVGVAPDSAKHDLAGLVDSSDIPHIAAAAEAGGNPVIPLVALLRKRVESASPDAARWMHRGMTSQDVLDTALMLCARDALTEIEVQLSRQVRALCELAERHRETAMVGRTLTQHAVPITFGAKAAAWLDGLLDAADTLTPVLAGLPAQFGGAAGTLSAATELATVAGLDDPAGRALEVASRAAAALGLAHRLPWHGSRAPVTAVGHALCAGTSAWGRLANDVLTLTRPEIGELAEPAAPGRGGSSAMPQKVNPVLSVLLRRAALDGPARQLQLLTAAAEAHDERPAGSWHLEWQALHLLGRHAVTAAHQATELLEGLQVDEARMATNLAGAGVGVLAEQRSILGDATPDNAASIGVRDASDLIVTGTVERAERWSERRPVTALRAQ